MADTEAEKALSHSLATYGQLAPVLRRAGQIVDGRRRLAALSALGREPWVIDLPVDGADHANAALLGRSFAEINGCRRELSIGVRAAIADTLATLRRGSNQHGGGKGASRAQAARTMGLSADTLDRYRRIKHVDDVHQKVLAGTMSLPQAVRTVECRELAQRASATVLPNGDLRTCVDQLATERASFSVFYVDPPWNYGLKEPGTHCAEPRRHYPSMSLAEIMSLPVNDIAAKDAVLFLWTPNSLLADALDVMAAWGFVYVTNAVWVKRKGCPTRGKVRPTHELLLMGRRGQGVPSEEPAMTSVFVDSELVKEHSRKPAHFAKELERMYPDAGMSKVELFCRQARPGWTVLGNQVSRVEVNEPAANDDAAGTPAEVGDHALASKPTQSSKPKPALAPRGHTSAKPKAKRKRSSAENPV